MFVYLIIVIFFIQHLCLLLYSKKMGLKYARRVSNKIANNSIVFNTPNEFFNIYIDGPLLLFNKKTITLLENENTTLDEITNSVFSAFMELFFQIKSKYKNMIIREVLIVFDGKRIKFKELRLKPNRKLIQRYATDESFSIYDITEKINGFLKKVGICDHIKFLVLNQGEAENEIVFTRNSDLHSLIISNDSDMNHICYNYTKQSKNDIIFVYVPQTNILKNMDLYRTKIPKNVFKILLFMGGTDFNPPALSTTMLEAMFQLLLSETEHKNKEIQEYVNDLLNYEGSDVIYVMHKIIHLLIFHRKSISISFRKLSSTTKETTFEEMSHYIKIIDWLLSYSNNGYLECPDLYVIKSINAFQLYRHLGLKINCIKCFSKIYEKNGF